MGKRHYYYAKGKKNYYDEVVVSPPHWVVRHEMTVEIETATSFRLRRKIVDGKAKAVPVWNKRRHHNGKKLMHIKRRILEIQPDMGVETWSGEVKYVVHEDGSIRRV